MGATQTVPMFSPDGKLGDIPYEHMHDALAAGFKQGVTMKTADGQLGVIPADKVPAAAKSGLQIVPLGEQDTQHPGFWHSLYSDVSDMAKSAIDPKNIALNAATLGMGSSVKALMDAPQTIAHEEQQKKEGYSLPYRILSPVAENLGVNVGGMEQSAKEGDVAGVAGHAATVPAVMAASAGLAKAAPVISDVAQAAATKASRAAEVAARATPKQVAQGVGAISGGISGHGTLSAPGAYYGAKTLGNIAESLLGKERANMPIFAKAPELTLDNITDAVADTIAQDRARLTQQQAGALGKLPQTGAQPAAQSGEALATTPVTAQAQPPKGGAAPRFTLADRAAAQSLLQDALKQHSADVVDAAVPQSNHGANLHTQAQVDFFLKRGDVAGAEQALDSGAKQANPAWTPPEQRAAVPTTDDIRKAVQTGNYQPQAKQSIASRSRADLLEDQGIQQEMQADLRMHEWSAESEARKEFIARNSTGFSKTEEGGYSGSTHTTPDFYMTRAVRGKSVQAAGPSSSELIDLLNQSLDQARKQKKQ
jgi:hypothetical protein